MLFGLAALVAGLPAAASQPAGDSSDAGDETAEEVLVRASAVAERPGVMPGGTVWVGVRFEIKDGWHTYWPGQNDTGFGTEITPSGPEGVSFGPTAWPAPHRYTAPGDILDHVHESEVTALVPVTAPADAAIGSSLDLSFDLAWLVCKLVCIPGWETVTLSLPVVEATPGTDASVAGVFAAARARIPVKNDGRAVSIEWDEAAEDADGRTVRLRASGASRMAFYPDDAGDRVVGLLRDGEAASEELVLRLNGQEPRLSGVVEVYSADGKSRVYSIGSRPGATR
jgi:thiol:disulfide interchange protein DsbD